MLSSKTVLVVGFGDIGAACGKIAKHGFGARVIGLKRRPEQTPKKNLAHADMVVGLDELDKWIPEVDFVVGVLPNTPDNENFFDYSRVFSKMRKDSVFMNVGRGATVNEDDLVKVLKQESIAGAVLDVYKTEPLPTTSELW